MSIFLDVSFCSCGIRTDNNKSGAISLCQREKRPRRCKNLSMRLLENEFSREVQSRTHMSECVTVRIAEIGCSKSSQCSTLKSLN